MKFGMFQYKNNLFIPLQENKHEQKKLMEQVVELYQIASVVGGYVISKINDSNAVNEINKLTEPMRENIGPYEHNPFNMTNWNEYSDKLKDIFEVIKKELV